MELLEVQLTTAEGQVAVFTFTVEKLNDLAPQLHALAKVGLFEVCVPDYGMSVWSVIDGEPCGCDECDSDPTPCQCENLDDDLVEDGWTCYTCHETRKDNPNN